MKTKIDRAEIGGDILKWAFVPGNDVDFGTIYKTTRLHILLSGNQPLKCEKCAINPARVNFKQNQVMIKSGWGATNDPFANAISMEFSPVNNAQRVLGVGIQYAVDAPDGFKFTALLKVNGMLPASDNPNGETIKKMNGKAVFLGVLAEAGEAIEKAEFTVLPISQPNINGFYINSLQYLLG